MKEKIKKYMWLWEMIGAALILTLSIVIAVESKIIPLTIGIIFALLGLLRIIPLVKTTDDKLLKYLYAIELVIEVIVGGLLITYAFIEKDNAFARFINNNGHYFIGGVLYLRGFMHFFATTVKQETYPFAYFVVNIVILTLGTVLIVKNVNIEQIRWFIFALGIVCFLFVGYTGFRGYNNYRGEYAIVRETKKLKKEKNKDTEEEKEDINIDKYDRHEIEEIDDPDDRENIIEDNQDDSNSINA